MKLNLELQNIQFIALVIHIAQMCTVKAVDTNTFRFPSLHGHSDHQILFVHILCSEYILVSINMFTII